MSNTDNTLPEELQKEIELLSDKAGMEAYGKEYNPNYALNGAYCQGYESGYIAGATEYAPYKVRCEKALQYIGDMHSSGCIELNNYHINEIQKLLDGKHR
jgi:hypothetical protein